MSEDRPAAVLTDTHRNYLRGDGKDRQSAQERALRSRLRERVYNGLLDGSLLSYRLPQHEREQIFSAWQNAGEQVDEGELGLWDEPARQERNELRHALVGWLAFIYRGVEDGDVDRFENILTNAIATAEAARDRQVVDVTLDVDYRDQLDTEELLQRFQNGDSSLSGPEVAHLQSEGAIDSSDLQEYYNQLGSAPDAGIVFGDDASELLDEEIDDVDSS